VSRWSDQICCSQTDSDLLRWKEKIKIDRLSFFFCLFTKAIIFPDLLGLKGDMTLKKNHNFDYSFKYWLLNIGKDFTAPYGKRII
jgi:hypothetical protein